MTSSNPWIPLYKRWHPPVDGWQRNWAQKEHQMLIHAFVMDADWYHGPNDGQSATEYFISKSLEEDRDRESDRLKAIQEYKLYEFSKPSNSRKSKKKQPTKIINFSQPLTLGIGLSYYNDKLGIRRMLGSIFGTLPPHVTMPNFVVKVLAVDGPYKGFNSDNKKTSDDGSTQLVDNFLPAWEYYFPQKWQQPNAEIVHRHSNGAFTEFEKRNQYMEMAAKEKCDFLLVMDSDEYFQHGAINWEYFAKEMDYVRKTKPPDTAHIFNVAMYDVEPRYPCFRPRLFYHPEKLEYSKSHRKVITKRGAWPLSLGPHEVIPQPFIEIWHSHAYRPQYRQELQQDYEYRLESLESTS